MIEAIGWFVIVAIGFIIVLYIGSRPSKGEKAAAEARKEEQINDKLRKESRIQFISKYKGFLTPLIESGDVMQLDVLKQSLSNTLLISDQEVQDLIDNMRMNGMIELNDDGSITKGYFLSMLEYLYPNFIKFCKMMQSKDGIIDYSMMEENPHMVELINSTYSPIKDKYTYQSNSYIEFGLITKSEAIKVFDDTEIFKGEINLYILVEISQECEFLHRNFNKNGDPVSQYATKLKWRNVLIDAVLPLRDDWQIVDYNDHYNRVRANLVKRDDYRAIFGGKIR